MKDKPLHYSILLAIITIALFFIVYFFFSGFYYYEISLKINTLVLPFIYTVIVILFLYRKTNIEKLSFAQCFSNSFKILFTGFAISFLTIYMFLNYVDNDAQKLLQYQRLEKETTGLEAEYQRLKKPEPEQIEYYNFMMKYLKSDEAKNEKLINLNKMTLGIVSAITLFHIIISLFLSLFFRLRNPRYATINSNTTS